MPVSTERVLRYVNQSDRYATWEDAIDLTSMKEGTQKTTSLFVRIIPARYVSGVGNTGGTEGLNTAIIIPEMHWNAQQNCDENRVL